MDYQCPACRQLEGQLARARDDLHDSLYVAYRYFPLDMHPLAFEAAVAAECAREQGRFAEMHRALFGQPLQSDSLPMAALIAQSAIVDTALFARCVSDSTSAAVEAVESDLSHVRSLNLGGTPGVQIGDRITTGALTAQEIVDRVREAAGIAESG